MGINVGFFFGEIILDLELVQCIEKIDHDSSLQKNTYKLDFACFFTMSHYRNDSVLIF
jgi:hypothetical protein